MTDFVLGKSTKLRTIAIRVKDRDKAIAFYRDVLGFDLKREENELAILGFKGAEGEVIWLEESPRANDHFGEIKKMQRIRLDRFLLTSEPRVNILLGATKKSNRSCFG